MRLIDAKALDTDTIKLIESLQKQLAVETELHQRFEKLALKNAMEYDKICDQLAASQRRADTAVEDIHKMRDGGECDICKHYNSNKNTCAKPFIPYDDCFEWRGVRNEESEEE